MGEIGNINRQLKYRRHQPVKSIHAARHAHTGRAMPTGNLVNEISGQTWYTRIPSIWATSGKREKGGNSNLSKKWHPSPTTYRKWIHTGRVYSGTGRWKNLDWECLHASCTKHVETRHRWISSKEPRRRHTGLFPQSNRPNYLWRLECQGRRTVTIYRWHYYSEKKYRQNH